MSIGISSTTSSVGSSTDINIPKPVTVNDNDILVAIIGGKATTTGTLASQSGWVKYELTTATGNDVYTGIFYRTVPSAASLTGTFTFTGGVVQTWAAFISALSGVNATSPEDVAFTNQWVNLQNVTAGTSVSLTTVDTGAFGYVGWCVNADTATTQGVGLFGTSNADDLNGILNVYSGLFGAGGSATGTTQLSAIAVNQESQYGVFLFKAKPAFVNSIATPSVVPITLKVNSPTITTINSLVGKMVLPRKLYSLDVNWSDPITKALVSCVVYNNPPGRVIDIANPKHNVSTAIPSWSRRSKGYAAVSPSFSNATTTDLDFTSGPFTVMSFFNFAVAPGAGEFPSPIRRYHDSGNGNNAGWALFGNPPDGTNTFSFDTQRNDTSPYPGILQSGVTPTAGNWHLCGTSDGTTKIIYVNGVAKATSTVNPNPLTETSNSYNSTTGVNTLNRVYITYAWKRALRPSEVRELYRNPYIFLQPRKRKYFFAINPVQANTTIVSPTTIYITLKINNPTIIITKNTVVSPTIASVSLIVRSPTVSITSSVIAFDSASNSGYQAASSSYSWNHTCTGNNRYLTVGIAMLSLAQTVTSIKYNGINLVLLGVRSSITGACRTELWGLTAPATGTNSIDVVLSGAIASIGCASSYTGVNQFVSTENFNSNQATNVGAADATVAVSGEADKDWAVDIVATDDTVITAGAGQTERANISGAGGSGAMSSEGPQTPPAIITMSWTNVGALATWSISSIALRPITADIPVLPTTVYITVKVNTSIASTLTRKTVTPTTAYIAIQVNAPSAKYSKSAIASTSMAFVKVQVNTATASTGATSSANATPSLAVIRIQVNTSTARTGGSVVALPATAKINLLVNTSTGKVIKSSIASTSLNLVSVQVNSPTIKTSRNAFASPSVATIRILVNTPSVSISRNATATPTIKTLSVICNNPAVKITVSAIALSSKVLININVLTATATVSYGQILLDVRILLESKMVTTPYYKSRIDKYINESSQIQTAVVNKSRINKYLTEESEMDTSVLIASKT